ncbi:MAG: Holliday junction branch migration protein RuvA [Myxococcota bacterium]
MIAWLKGRVRDRRPTRLVLDVHGVGYAVTVTVQNPAREGQEVELHVHTHVREDTLQLFGFLDPDERRLFDLLLTVPNIGPVKAMQVLQTSVSDFVAIVVQRDVGRLAKLPGVGKKTAERILLDLADKVMGIGVGTAPAPLEPASQARADLVSALLHLGYREAPAVEAAESVLTEAADESLQEQLRRALVRLSEGRGKTVE